MLEIGEKIFKMFVFVIYEFIQMKVIFRTVKFSLLLKKKRKLRSRFSYTYRILIDIYIIHVFVWILIGANQFAFLERFLCCVMELDSRVLRFVIKLGVIR